MARSSMAYVEPSRCTLATSSAAAPARRTTSSPTASSMRSTLSWPACRARSIILPRVSTPMRRDCSRDVTRSPESPSRSGSPVAFCTSATATTVRAAAAAAWRSRTSTAVVPPRANAAITPAAAQRSGCRCRSRAGCNPAEAEARGGNAARSSSCKASSETSTSFPSRGRRAGSRASMRVARSPSPGSPGTSSAGGPGGEHCLAAPVDGEGDLPGQNAVEHHAQCVDVGPLVLRRRHPLLRGHVSGRASLDPRLPERVGEAEVEISPARPRKGRRWRATVPDG